MYIRAHLGDGVRRQDFWGHVGESSVGTGLHPRHYSQVTRQTKVSHLGAELVAVVCDAAQQHIACTCAHMPSALLRRSR